MPHKKPGKFLFIFSCCFTLLNAAVQGQHFTTTKSAEGIEIRERGKKVLFYQVRPKSADGKYERAGYVHPLYDLDERILTEDMPADHLHHHGVFWAWHQIMLNGKNIGDGWMSENISYAPVETDLKVKRKCIELRSEITWNTQLEKKLTPLIKEKTKISVYRSTPQYRIIDFDITLFALTDDLKIGGSDDAKGYGGFSLRLKLPGDIQFVSGNGEVEPTDTAVFAGPWMDISGSFQGTSMPETGVAVFCYMPGDSSRNAWILRKAASMQNVQYPGRTPIPLSREGLKLKYRVVVHNAGMSNGDIDQLYREYIKH